MEISGKKLQLKLIENLKSKIDDLKRSGVVPGIAIVTLGPEETWEAYVGQKVKLAKKLGIEAKMINLKPGKTEEVLSVVKRINDDSSIHGLIVQRPFPTYIDTVRIIQSVSREKDIDGFGADSIYEVPVWLAVKYLITHIGRLINQSDAQLWLSNQSILVVGKGETAGKPVINGLRKLKISPMVMDSRTESPENLFAMADIVIFATGKQMQVPFEKLKKDCILIGIGLHRKDGLLQGDFDENEAKKHVLYYTPSPGGVGPLNLYFLFENLMDAATRSIDRK